MTNQGSNKIANSMTPIPSGGGGGVGGWVLILGHDHISTYSKYVNIF